MMPDYFSAVTRHVTRRVRDRLGFSLVIAGAGLGAGIVSGSSAIAVIAAVGAGTLIVGLIPSRSGQDRPVLPGEARGRGQPFAWTFTGSPSTTVATAIDRLQATKLTLDDRSDSHARLSGGSQLRLRLLGGYFIDPIHLPIIATVETTESEEKVEVRVYDGIGSIAVRDKKLESRYALRAEQIRDALGY